MASTTAPKRIGADGGATSESGTQFENSDVLSAGLTMRSSGGSVTSVTVAVITSPGKTPSTTVEKSWNSSVAV